MPCFRVSYPVLFVFFLVSSAPLVRSLRVERPVFSTDSYHFLTSFCFAGKAEVRRVDGKEPAPSKRNSEGVMEYESGFSFSFVHKNTSNYGLAVYYRSSESWDSIQVPGMTCGEKVRVAKDTQNFFEFDQFAQQGHDPADARPLAPPAGYTRTFGALEFNAQRARWYYFVLTNCDLRACDRASERCTGPIRLNATIHMTNGGGPLREFSYDHFRRLPTSAAFFGAYLCLGLGALYLALVLAVADKLHPTAKLLFMSVWVEALAYFVDLVRAVSFQSTGFPETIWREAALHLHMGADSLLVLVVILFAKGWTVVRRKISALGRVKIGVYATLYWASGVVTVAWFAAVEPTQVEQLYLYETPPGWLRLWFRGFAVVWFAWSSFTTAKLPAFRRRRMFYAAFFPGYFCWLLSLVFAYVIGASVSRHQRRGFDYAFGGACTLAGHLGFFFLFRPGKFNQTFPFAFETKEQERLKGERLRERLRGRGSGVGGATAAPPPATTTTSSSAMEMTAFGPTYAAGDVVPPPLFGRADTEVQNGVKVTVTGHGRNRKTTVTGNSEPELANPRENIGHLSSGLRSRLRGVYEYADQLHTALQEYFDEEDDDGVPYAE